MDKSILQNTVNHLNTYGGLYELYDEYYEGNQFSVFNNLELRESVGLLADVFRTYSENLCPSIVNTAADRLILNGFGASNRQDVVDTIWHNNKLNLISTEIHTETLKLGDAYVICWFDKNGNPKLYRQDTECIAVQYDDDGDIISASKTWTENKRLRLTLYYPDRIERWITQAETSNLTLEPSDYIEYDAVIPNPYNQVPVFRFSTCCDFACGEIAKIKTLQDALNWSSVYMLIGEVGTILPLRYITGVQAERNQQTGRGKPIRTKPGEILQIFNENASVGQFDGADLTQFIKIHSDIRQAIARVSSTPLHAFYAQTGDYPSGSALRTSEAPLLGKISRYQAKFGDIWQDVIKFTARLSGANIETITTDWEDTSPDNSLEQSTIALNMIDAGVPREEAIKTCFGFSEQEMADWTNMQTDMNVISNKMMGAE